MVVELLLVTVFLILAGYADAICDAWRDGKYPLTFLFWRWPIWYEGSKNPDGVSPYKNNGIPWQSDFWHCAKLVRVYAYCFAIGIALGGYWIFAVPVFAFVTGKTFALSYHSF